MLQKYLYKTFISMIMEKCENVEAKHIFFFFFFKLGTTVYVVSITIHIRSVTAIM